MRLFEYFRANRRGTADTAKERLQVIVAHERSERNRASYMPQLQAEILEVIRKYIPIEQDDLKVSVDREDNCEILALNVVLPEDVERHAAHQG